MKRKLNLLSLLTILTTLMMIAPAASAAGGDFSLDFIASAPYTYNHATGGGAYNDRDIGKYDDVVESLEGGDFQCYDTVTYLTAITVADLPADANQTIEIQYSFLADTTGQTGAAHGDVSYVGINYGNVENGGGVGLGNFAPDTGMVDDGGSTATIVSEGFVPVGTTPFNGADELILVIQVDDLEAGEQVIVRIDTLLECLPGSRPTGNLQGQMNSARVVEADGQPMDDTVPGGEQTIPFKQIGDLIPPPPPAAITLVSFEAAAQANAIGLTWTTATELDNLGFNIYRARSADGPRSRLNQSLIAGQVAGQPAGASYEFVDRAVRPGTTYYYWLEDVDMNGTVSLHGPVSAQITASYGLVPARSRPIPLPSRSQGR